MTKKARLIILFILAALFLVAVPYLLIESLGYRVDFKHFKITATGGIYVKALPQGADISIDTTIHETTNILTPTVFTQNLLPGDHTVSIKKEGYYDYQKTLDIKEHEVAKLEHVQLVKQQIPFTLLTSNLLDGMVLSDALWSDDSSRVLLKSKENYFLFEPFLATPKTTPLAYLTGSSQPQFNPQNSSQIFYIKNKNIYISTQALPLIKNVTDYTVEGSAITYLSLDGSTYTVQNDGKTNKKISTEAFSLTYKNSASPDGQRILYYNDHELLYSANSSAAERIFLNRFSQKIGQAYWLGNDYIIFTLGGKVVISEIDIRGNINMVTLPSTVTLNDGTSITLENPNIYLNQQDKRLYVFTKNNLIVSERLIP